MSTDGYKEMINNPGFAEHEILTEKLMNRVEATLEEELVFERQSPLYVVEGLALARSSLTKTFIDIPGFGRGTEGNPQPNFSYMSAVPTGYEEEPILI